jgi:hypothetical protein
MLTTHLHLASRLRMSGAIPYSPYMSLCRGQRQIYLFLLFFDGDNDSGMCACSVEMWDVW